ncbi:MAG: prolyl oligopeptidase family serine peptidase [Tunicatimonas sp.]
MKSIFYSLAVGLVACATTEETTDMSVDYPPTEKVNQVDTYFGTEVPDPYRWLEDDRSAETAAWVEAENEVTEAYLSQIPFREAINERLTTLWNYEKYSAPVKEGDAYYFYKNDGLQNQSVLYRQANLRQANLRQANLDAEPEIFLDPNTFSNDGTVSLGSTSFTEDGSLLAYSISESGSDWRKILVMDVASRTLVGDTIQDAKFTGIAWRGNEGFYYSSYDKSDEGSALSARNSNHKLFYHQLGTSQTDDQLVFGGEALPRRYVGAGVTEDQRYLVITAAVSTSGNELYVKDLSQPGSEIVPVVEGFDSEQYVVHSEGTTLYIMTNRDAPNQRLVTVDAGQPQPENWQDLIPERKEVLQSSSFAGGKLFLNYLKDASTRIEQYDLQGNKERDITLPTLGTASGFNGKEDSDTVFYAFTSFTYPTTIYAYDIGSGESTVLRQPTVDFDPDAYETKQVFYSSKDGTKVPMFIVHKKGLELNGQNPTYLYGYGGFNISLSPSFSITNLYWLENGGVYAMPNLRGGGEYGESWHEAGTQLNKQNVFDDFIAAAEYLKQEKYTSTDKLAISGRSNGGLLVGATMTQRPDLCRVALPGVGVLDMLRYHQFTAGAGWAYDYGIADSSQAMFDYLYAYSPLHNIEEDASYPATLITTADHDDRVVPAHSFKFAATLQEKQAGDNPVLIRIDTKAGHGAGKPTAMQIAEWTDLFAFTFYNMDWLPENAR